MAWIFSYTFLIFPDLCIPFLPSGRYLLLFSFLRCETFSSLLLPSGLYFLPPASRSFWIASFYRVYSSYWSLTSFSCLLLIKFFIFLSPSRMGLTNPGRALGRSLLLSIFHELSTLSGTPPFSTNLFRLACLFALLIKLIFSFLIGALAWFIIITKDAPFESIEVFRKNRFLALYFFFFSSMIFLFLCLLPSTDIFMLTI